jgi:hypothetical protein
VQDKSKIIFRYELADMLKSIIHQMRRTAKRQIVTQEYLFGVTDAIQSIAIAFGIPWNELTIENEKDGQ